MSKRFTATEKWDKPWYRKLPPRLKCLWQFLCDRCDQAGVIEMDWDLASFQIGEDAQEADLRHFDGRIRVLPSGKILILSFVHYQYGRLSPACKPHAPVLAAIAKHGLTASDLQQDEKLESLSKGIQSLSKPIDSQSIAFQRLQEEEEEMDKEKEEVPETETETENPKPPRPVGSFPTLEQVQAFANTVMIRADEAKAYWLARDGVGWVRSSNGASVPIRNWQSDMQSYVNGQRQREAEAKAKQAQKPKQRLVC